MTYPTPENEVGRLEELEKYNILDSMPEHEYDDIAQLAAQICNTKMSTVALIDNDRKWHKAKFGIDKNEVPREVSICSHTIMGTEPLIVNDTKEHYLFRSIGMVTHPPNVRFYAGIPLINPNGFALGTLCVIDTEPKNLLETQKKALMVLANHSITLLELRRQKIQLEIAVTEKEKALDEVKVLSGIIPICSSCKNIRDDKDYWHRVENYISSRTDAQFTHGCCPPCYEKIRSTIGQED